MEAAADQVVHAAERHPVERRGASSPPRRGGAGTRAPAPAGTWAPAPSRPTAGRSSRRARAARPRAASSVERLARRASSCALERMCSAGCAPTRSTSLRRSRHASATREQHLLERRQPVPRLRREVGAAEERLARRRQEHRHRPAAVPGQRDDGVHVDRVEVGPLLAVDLDRDEVLVQHARGQLVLERLPLHHVAPVARGVADREQDRACPRRARARAPRRPTGTSRPGCACAAGGTGDVSSARRFMRAAA